MGQAKVVVRKGKAYVVEVKPVNWKLVAVVVTICLAVLVALPYLIGGWRTAEIWLEQNYILRTPQARIELVPEHSKLNTVLVDWVYDNSAKRVSRDKAQLIVRHVFNESVRQQVDPWLVLALIKVESEFDSNVVSHAGAIGLTQVVPKWHIKKINTANIYDPQTNISIGVQILKDYLAAQSGDESRALLQYNGSLDIPGSTYAARVKNTRTLLLAYADQALLKQI